MRSGQHLHWHRTIVSALVWVSALAGLSGCSPLHKLPAYGQIQDFELVSQTGQTITLANLKGKVWIADTIYTTCPGPCPMMSSRLSSVAREVARLSNVRLVSLTVDPSHDTPDVLLDYSQRYHATPDRWLFLTGRQQMLNLVSENGLRLSPVDGSLERNIQFALVDANATVRGYYNAFDSARLKDLVTDTRQLARE